jgi:hypothetical protein
MGGGLAGVEGRAHATGWRALETGEDAEREAFRTAASEAIKSGELARCVWLTQTRKCTIAQMRILHLCATALTWQSGTVLRWRS